jgi:hypothetical protein
MYSWFRSFLGGSAFFLVALDEDALVSVFLNGQRPVMMAVEEGGCYGSGRGQGSASYKAKVDAAFQWPLMVAQSWKRRWPVVRHH